jgi:ribosomal protein L29
MPAIEQGLVRITEGRPMRVGPTGPSPLDRQLSALVRTATVDEHLTARLLEAEAELAALRVEPSVNFAEQRQLLQAKSNLAALRARQATDRLQTSSAHPAAATHIGESDRGVVPLDR